MNCAAEKNKEKSLEQQIKELQKQVELYRACDIGGVFSIALDNDFTLFYGNDKFYQIFEYTPEKMKKTIDNKCRLAIYQDDYQMVKSAMQEGAKSKDNYAEFSMRIISGNNNLKYVLCSGKFEVKDGLTFMNGLVVDITAQRKAEQALLESEEKARIAIEVANIFTWEYDIQNHTTTFKNRFAEKIMGADFFEKSPESVVNSGKINKESIKTYVNMHRAVENGEKFISGDIHFIDKKNNGLWMRCTYTTIFDDFGKPAKAIGCGTDFTAIKEMERKFNDEVRYQEVAQSENLLAKVRANLTKDIRERYIADVSLSIEPETMLSYSEHVTGVANAAVTYEDKIKLKYLFSREHAIESYYNGETQCSIDYQRKKNDGSVVWVKSTVKTFENPENGNIMLFMYTYDITAQKTAQMIVNRLTDIEFERIALIDVQSGEIRYHDAKSKEFNVNSLVHTDFKNEIEDILRHGVTEEELEEALSALSFRHILDKLETTPLYRCAFNVVQNGKKRRKQWQMCYLDDTKQTLLMSRSDITEIYEKEQQQLENIKAALIMAQQASVAKSDFLSRMSHEIRTPMNAIIGMSTLAAQCISDPAQVSDCISKVGISARFLLSLINDILDMSRIESGKVMVKKEKIVFEEFIYCINAICYEQAAQKGVDYDAIVLSFTEAYYIGDSMKLQQVLINIIGNAIKFTQAGGKVQFLINQEKIKDGKAYLKFTVNDTGIGIKDDFLPKLFQPFEQADTGITAMYGGTGLGLAICNNLIQLMGGKISVNSIEGIGTEFTIEVALELCDENPKKVTFKPQIQFDKMTALVVDDEILICENTKKVLDGMGIKSDIVESGEKALKIVTEKWKDRKYYDIILIDWKMPGMDGIETTREIRKIVGDDVTIVIMTAYDWALIEHEAKLAGVNMLVSKPIFNTSLTSTFEKIYNQKEQDKPRNKVTEYDFSGKRVLLVEDHLLNVEVAKRLLTNKGFEVKVAENGLAAIEAFVKNEAGYFDAILMDIRMPIMDGLTATKSIRHTKQADAKTIPIIAMSANAFDEDMEKSKNAGINVHLAKPIEPQKLYQTLAEFF